jgi:DNA-binding response OmpR family regulator
VVLHHARVLVVDDEPAIRALIAKIVERAGYPVDIARDGGQAIAMLDAAPYDVLVIDLMMPNIDGYDVVNHLRDRDGLRPAIIVITAGDSSAIRRLDGSIVHSVVRKPFDIDVLADLIGAAAQTMENERAKHAAEGDVLPFPDRRVC